MNRVYELIYVLNPAVGEEKLETVKERVSALVEAKADEVLEVDVWGNKRLAYEIEDQREGFYTLVKFSAQADVPKEIERVLSITDGVLRYLIVREDD